jgi:diguanylate cyclase (GGDEF)-like protein/PAS domain S-box-containing protein
VVNQETRVDAGGRDAVLDRLVEREPTARIVAIGPDGMFVPLPDSVPDTLPRLPDGYASALELVLPADLPSVIDTWERALRTGVATVSARLLRDRDRSVALYVVDMTHRYGVYLGLVAGWEDAPDSQAERAVIRPRLGISRKDRFGVVLHIDDALVRILGWTAAEMVGRRSLEIVHPDDHGLAISAWMEMLAAPVGDDRRARLRHHHADGSWVWIEVTNRNLLDDPAHGCVIAEMLDISDEMAALEALRANEQMLRRLTEALPFGVLQINLDRRIVYRNERIDGILDRAPADTLSEQFDEVIPADWEKLDRAFGAAVRDGEDSDVEIGLASARLGVRRCTVRLRPLSDASGVVTGGIVCVVDVTEEVRLHEELERRATYDGLTGSHNRTSILTVLADTLAGTGKDGRGTAVIFFDLDRFKEVNDLYGHAAGDRLLTVVTRRLMTGGRDSDLVGRVGGDEFLVVCRHVESAAEALRIAERLVDAVGHTVDLGATAIVPTVSVGVAWTPRPCDADMLVTVADTAMYESKKLHSGRPTYAPLGTELGAPRRSG